MDVWLEIALVASVLLAVPALIQWRWSRALALLCVAVLVGVVTTTVAYMPLRGPGDAVVGRGWRVIYGMAASFQLTIAAAAIFMWSAARMGAAATAEEGSERDSVAMFNHATQGDEIDP